MASSTTGLPDRYRPLDQVGPDEPTATGVIRGWRAKDRILNRDVAIRVHTPAGEAAHAWITRALTAGGLANPSLAMVYDASEGSGDPEQPGGAAYVVNEWIDGETLAERLARGPMPEREARTVLRRLADGVAEAHRVGLAVGGLTPANVVLRPNGLVGLRAVPAATGTIDGDIAALGTLLEACLTGLRPEDSGPRPLAGPPDLVALVRRAQSTQPGQGLSSVAAMAALLAERPRTGPTAAVAQRVEDTDSGWLRRLRDHRRPADGAEHGPVEDLEAPRPAAPRRTPRTVPPVPPVHPASRPGTQLPSSALGAETIDVGRYRPAAATPPVAREAFEPPTGDDDEDGLLGVLAMGPATEPPGTDAGAVVVEDPEDRAAQRRLLVVGLPVLALAVVVALAWWLGSSVLSVAGSVDHVQGSTPSAGTIAAPSSSARAGTGKPAAIAGAQVFDPFGDGEPENDRDVPKTYDGNAATRWSTLEYRGSANFGNLKQGVGVLYDLGRAQKLAGVGLTTTTPGATVEIRVADKAALDLDGFTAVASGTLSATTDLSFDKPVEARYVLVWITGLVDSGAGFSADLAEVAVHPAG